MLLFPAADFRKRSALSGKRKRPAPPAPPPVALTLVSATYDRTSQLNWIRLTFDRAVDIAAINVGAITVNDDPSDEAYFGSGVATLFAPQTVQVPMVISHGATGPGTELTATSATGIVAVDDGGTWAGVTDLVLPFP